MNHEKDALNYMLAGVRECSPVTPEVTAELWKLELCANVPASMGKKVRDAINNGQQVMVQLRTEEELRHERAEELSKPTTHWIEGEREAGDVEVSANTVKLAGLFGKYDVWLNQRPHLFEFNARRHGEDWRDLAGDNLVLALVHKIAELHERLALESRRATEELHELRTSHGKMARHVKRACGIEHWPGQKPVADEVGELLDDLKSELDGLRAHVEDMGQAMEPAEHTGYSKRAQGDARFFHATTPGPRETLAERLGIKIEVSHGIPGDEVHVRRPDGSVELFKLAEVGLPAQPIMVNEKTSRPLVIRAKASGRPAFARSALLRELGDIGDLTIIHDQSVPDDEVHIILPDGGVNVVNMSGPPRSEWERQAASLTAHLGSDRVLYLYDTDRKLPPIFSGLPTYHDASMRPGDVRVLDAQGRHVTLTVPCGENGTAKPLSEWEHESVRLTLHLDSRRSISVHDTQRSIPKMFAGMPVSYDPTLKPGQVRITDAMGKSVTLELPAEGGGQ